MKKIKRLYAIIQYKEEKHYKCLFIRLTNSCNVKTFSVHLQLKIYIFAYIITLLTNLSLIISVTPNRTSRKNKFMIVS